MFAWYNLQWILRLPRTSQGQRTILACDNGDLQYSDCVPPILYREDPISSLTRVETSHPCNAVHLSTKTSREKVTSFFSYRECNRASFVLRATIPKQEAAEELLHINVDTDKVVEENPAAAMANVELEVSTPAHT